MSAATEEEVETETEEEPVEEPSLLTPEEETEDPVAPEGVDVAAVIKEAVDKATAEANRVADRRINQLLEGQKGDKDEGKPKPERKPDTGVNVREARLAFREYLADEVTFLGADERSFAMEMGAALINVGAAGATDEDVLGRQVAAEVAASVAKMRTFYEERVKAGLKARGQLPDGKGGQPLPGPASAGSSSEYDKGAAIAREKFTTKED